LKRLVVDASTLVSGVASRPGGGVPWLILLALLDLDFEAVVCPKLIEEFRDALGNRYFQERFDAADLAEIVASVEEAAVKHENPSQVEALLRDPDDDYLVALARQAGAEAIVTGDRDLLDHPGLMPPAIDARGGCELLGLLD
jgi:putative PIN family toxin of toxin-antitoxin system